jgi:hypothetical protein
MYLIFINVEILLFKGFEKVLLTTDAYFPNMSTTMVRGVPILLKVLASLEEGPKTSREIMKETDASSNQVNSHLTTLKKCNIVTVHKANRYNDSKYYLNSKGWEMLRREHFYGY